QSGGPSLDKVSPLTQAARLVRQLRCTACHDRDGRFAARGPLLMEEGITGLAPAELPDLTWTGEKLRTEWIEDFVSGRIGSPRPWLGARMPRFGARDAAALARGLAAEHGLPAHADRNPHSVDEALAEVGR